MTMRLTDEQMREAVERLLSQEPDDRVKQAVERLTQGRSLDEWFTDIYLDVAEDDLMSFQEFRRVAERDKVSDDFLSGWVVLTREALRNLLRLVVRDGIGMTDNLDSVRTIVRNLNLKPNDPPIPFGGIEGELRLSDIEQARPEVRVEETEEQQDRSVPDRLWVVRERIRGMRSEVEDLSSLMNNHSGSCLSQVIDLLNQAEDLTDETMSLSMGQGFKVIDKGSYFSIWDDPVGVGIEFTKWDGENPVRLSYVRSEDAVFKDDEVIGRTFDRLIEFGRENYPQEFAHIPDESII